MLPNAAAAKAEEIKVRGYLLDTGHPQNGGKAAFFRAFGFDVADWAAMRDALLRHPAANQVTATKASPHVIKYEVRCSIGTPDGRNPCVTTVLIVEGGRPPRLVTTHP
jgi:hypothetical protein